MLIDKFGLGVAVIVALFLSFFSRSAESYLSSAYAEEADSGSDGSESETKENMSTQWKRPSEAEIKSKLNDEQYRVTQQQGTERPFNNAYWNNHADGIYVDVVSGEPLFSSTDKFDSGTGWPSFSKPIQGEAVKTESDLAHGMTRTEVRSSSADSHLGHVFPDGPGPSGERYCINSASLKFVPVEKLESEGYGKFLPMFGKKPKSEVGKKPEQPSSEVATLAGGCFWGMEELIRKIPGVIDTQVGYTGGNTAAPNYNIVKSGSSGHAESIEVRFDPSKVSYEHLLEFFFRMHDPTTLNRQGNDVGTQYRSAIFVHSDEQRQIAERVKDAVNKSGKWKNPVVTEIVDAGEFTPAEDYHQDYLEKHPGGYTCHFLRPE